jgi:hypothetical protein
MAFVAPLSRRDPPTSFEPLKIQRKWCDKMRQRNLEGRTPKCQRSADYMRVSAVMPAQLWAPDNKINISSNF